MQHNVGQIHSYQLVIGLSNVTMQREKKSCYHRKIQKRKQILQVQLHNYTIHLDCYILEPSSSLQLQ
jgi:hypothetical protein